MPSNIANRITERIRTDIRSGHYADAGKLPTERALSDRFGVARNTIRRAIETLEREGLLVRQVGRGTFLTNDTDPSFQAQTPGMAERAVQAIAPLAASVSPRDLIEARLAIEPSIAAAAAANATDADLWSLDATQNKSAATSVMESFERHDAAIHKQLFAMTHNPLLISFEAVLASMRVNADWLAAKRSAYSLDLKRRYVEQHGAIIDAIRNRSPNKARQAMAVHLEEVRRALLE